MTIEELNKAMKDTLNANYYKTEEIIKNKTENTTDTNTYFKVSYNPTLALNYSEVAYGCYINNYDDNSECYLEYSENQICATKEEADKFIKDHKRVSRQTPKYTIK